MSGGNDNIFARWSRRKLSVRSAGFQATDDEKLVPDAAAVDAGAARRATAQDAGSTQDEPDGPAEPLPRVEDLTPESDITAFLRKGVPAALRSAATRRMWSLDPAIRDYVGPSEYAWDFNQAGSMAGFGPLDAKEAVVSFLSRMALPIEANERETAAIPRPWPARAPGEAHAQWPENTPPVGEADTDAPEAQTVEPTEVRSPVDGAGEIEAADAGPVSPPSRSTEVLSRPRHGRAIPR
ncbi:DUF3306 domain-containing protein [Mesorhizobium sp. M7A.F.Ca.US.001.01.1.1]|nr:DUF3306 domain-containing protein [Mesorhizobium sp. M7A.F.Ca.US.001.01.1.1]